MPNLGTKTSKRRNRLAIRQIIAFTLKKSDKKYTKNYGLHSLGMNQSSKLEVANCELKFDDNSTRRNWAAKRRAK